MLSGRSKLIGLVSGIAVITALAHPIGAYPVLPPEAQPKRDIVGTIWVANRATSTIRAFNAATGEVLTTIEMAGGSQSPDLAYANGKLYVAEEKRGASSPSVAVVDPAAAWDPSVDPFIKRFESSQPHHMHASNVIRRDLAFDGPLPCSYSTTLVAYGVFDTNRVGVIDARNDERLGEWTSSSNSDARAHAGVFGPPSPSGDIRLYVTNDKTSELSAIDPWTGEFIWTDPLHVPFAHELVVTRDGKTAYVSGRAGNVIHIVDLEQPAVIGQISMPGLPDTLRLTASEQILTVGLRAAPARVAVVDTSTLSYETVTIGGPGTVAGHQWTSPDGRYTFAAFEGTGAGVAVIDHRLNNSVVQHLSYPGRPHGIVFVPTPSRSDERGDACGQA